MMKKPKIKQMTLFVRIITFGWARAICLAPIAIYIKKQWICSKTLINHEKIHWRQQYEMIILPFYIWYFIEWLIKIFIYGKSAYRNISFEREANAYQNNMEYLSVRKKFSWINYLIK